jgi:diguanylate cyclase (GGDEF)-like protein
MLRGVLTRRALREAAPALVAAELGRGGAVAVLALDIDHFKAVNDHADHACGDEALRLASATLQARLRPGAPLDAALARADDALYRAKRDGRNRVQVSLQAA